MNLFKQQKKKLLWQLLWRTIRIPKKRPIVKEVSSQHIIAYLKAIGWKRTKEFL